MVKAFATIQELERIGKSSYWRQRFLYPLLFRDHFYGIAYNRFTNESEYGRNMTRDLNYGFDFLLLKRLMKKLHQAEFPYILSKKFTNKFQFVREIIVIIFNLIFSLRTQDPMKKINEWNGYQSIHSVFPFMEDRIHNSNNFLDITIPHSLHPEILIRICRKHISDISFVHLLRFLLHCNRNFRISNPSHSVRNLFHCFLWNFCISSGEYCLIHLWKQIHRFQCTPFWFFLDKTEFIRKMQYISEQLNSQPIGTIPRRNCTIHYVRYQNNLILVTNGDIELIENWRTLLIIFWDKYFHSWLKPCRISVKRLSNNPLSILGYIIHTKNDLIRIRIRFLDYSIDTGLVIRGFCGIIPIIPSIRFLAREGFCNALGHPVCKLSWTTSTDNQILDRFDRIMKSICCYYSGCRRKKGSYQLQYILRFSCAKTLACKHKSTIRTVWKRYGSDFVTNSVSLREMKSNSSNSWRKDSNEKRFWRLTIIQTNFLVDFLQKSRNTHFARDNGR